MSRDNPGPTLTYSCDVHLTRADFMDLEPDQIKELLGAIAAISSVMEDVGRLRSEAGRSAPSPGLDKEIPDA